MAPANLSGDLVGGHVGGSGGPTRERETRGISAADVRLMVPRQLVVRLTGAQLLVYMPGQD